MKCTGFAQVVEGFPVILLLHEVRCHEKGSYVNLCWMICFNSPNLHKFGSEPSLMIF